MTTTATKTTKLHPDDQRCGNCAFVRARPGVGRTTRDMECRWDGPPWEERGVTAADWCRRWSARPAAKKTVPTAPATLLPATTEET